MQRSTDHGDHSPNGHIYITLPAFMAFGRGVNFFFSKSWNNSGHFCEAVFPTNNCTHLAAKHGNVNGDIEIKEEMFKGFFTTSQKTYRKLMISRTAKVTSPRDKPLIGYPLQSSQP